MRSCVMAGLVPAIHVFTIRAKSARFSLTPTAWMAGTSPAMTAGELRIVLIDPFRFG